MSLQVREKRILVIDDEEGIREMLCVALEFEGFEVATAVNGKDALRILNGGERPGLILLDLMMPIMNGWEFYEELTNNPFLSDIPVVVLTAFAKMAGDIPAKDIIKKPISLDALLETVNKFMA